eukprot:gnl/MRDRNA2_/MRDRNA2_91568_c0_seq1.p1 gnl/MRDRNA2_/MRDRNA2_91568_c0~~gnl/MRDRNA2_/MRDRNA2_91568_c0_seq1.p1  ORF type:complete len:536 (+),score=83.51 gnl/MRDRNA2_/MRDRNA2_91568_c0_seq1:134-1741(+)
MPISHPTHAPSDGALHCPRVPNVPECNINDTGKSLQWLSECHAPAERSRRVSALHHICERLLRLQPQNRPRSLAALGRWLRTGVSVKSYTIHPVALAQALEAPQMVQELLKGVQGGCPANLLESLDTLPEGFLCRIRERWISHVSRNAFKGSRGASDWIASQAHVDKVYELEEVVSVLDELDLIQYANHGAIDCSHATPETCASRLPVIAGCSSSAWKLLHHGLTSAVRHVNLPPQITAMIIGRKGVAIQQLQVDLEARIRNLQKVDQNSHHVSCPSVQLKIDEGILVLTLKWAHPWHRDCKEPQHVKETADAMKNAVAHHCNELYHVRCNKLWMRRQQGREHFQKRGQLYHAMRRSQCEEARKLFAVEKALTLPPPGYSDARASGHKDRMRHRHRTAQREKRRNLLRARALLSVTTCTSQVSPLKRWSSFAAQMNKTDEQQRCWNLLESMHLSCLSQTTGLCNKYLSSKCTKRDRGTVNRLQRQILEVAKIAGASVIISAAGQQVDKNSWMQCKMQRKCCRRQNSKVMVPGIDY